jgi:Predicted transcriptional regulator
MKYKLITVKVIDRINLNKEIGKLIRKERERKKITQTFLAQQLGITRAAVSNFEAGNHNIMVYNIYNISLILKVPLKKLLP